MFDDRSEYDRGVNTFSPDGRIFQVEYAMKAMKLGSSAVGIRTDEGVVLVVEKKGNSELMESIAFEKLCEVDFHIACAVSGIVADSRTLVDFARVEAQNHRFMYEEPISVFGLTQAVSDLALNFGEGDETSKKKPIARPYGVALLVAGVDDLGPLLYQIDPSGTMVGYKAKGIGSADEGIQSILDEHYNEKMNLEDAQKLALNALKQAMEAKIETGLVQLAVIPKATRRLEIKSENYVADLLKTLPELN